MFAFSELFYLNKLQNVNFALKFFYLTAFGVIGGSAATFSAIKAMGSTHFTPPCYISVFLQQPQDDSDMIGHINCCGPYQNITVHASRTQFCTAPNLKFYD